MKTNVPNQFTVGESLAWKKSFDDFPAGEGWILKYSFRGAGSGFDISATSDGDDFVLSVAPSVTGDCAAGKYFYQAFVEKGDERFLVDAGESQVLQSLSVAPAGTAFDGRSQVKKTLDAIDAMVQGKASLDQQSYVIGNRQLQRIPITELIALRDKYAQLYSREKRAERVKKGGNFFKTVLVRMKDD